LGLSAGWGLTVLLTYTRSGGAPVDAWCYYGFPPADPWADGSCFVYSPPLAQAMMAVQAVMPFEAFVALLRTIEMIALAALAGPALGLALFIPAVAIEINAANINILIAVAIVLSFRYPWMWAPVILAKVTPGIGILWFAVRREWRQLAIAIGVTASLAGVSWVIAPDLWRQYVAGLRAATDDSIWLIGWRLPLAALVVVWGARKDHRWALVVAVFLALPRWYYLSPVILVGLFPLVRLPRPLPWMAWWTLRSRATVPLSTTTPLADQPAAAAATSEGRTARAPSS